MKNLKDIEKQKPACPIPFCDGKGNLKNNDPSTGIHWSSKSCPNNPENCIIRAYFKFEYLTDLLLNNIYILL